MGWMNELWPEWHIVCELGAGAYGKVYKIKREDIGGTYFAALKVVSFPRDPSEIETLRARKMSDSQISAYFNNMVQDICREIAVMERLKGNTNIVSYEDHKIVEHSDDPGWDILIRMELLTPLAVYLETHPINEHDVCQFGIDICRALTLCESEKIIHRDIKPGNVFVSDFGSYKLGDFGLAKHFSLFSDNTVPQGTVHYMAPEVYRATGYDYSIDTYALGLILYRLMNRGREPFLPLPPCKISTEMYREANNRRLNAEVFPAPVDASPDMTEIILKACAYNPGDRYKSAEEMRKALRRCGRKHPPESQGQRIIHLLRKAVNNIFAEPDELESEYEYYERTLTGDGESAVTARILDLRTAASGQNVMRASDMDEYFSEPGDL